MARKSFLRDFTPRCSGSTASFSRDLEHPGLRRACTWLGTEHESAPMPSGVLDVGKSE